VSSPYLGQIIPVAFTFAPKNWAFCNGQTLPINQNQAIFSLLGTTYGGNGTTTFQLPDLQGRVAMHPGNGHTLGERGGEETVALNVNQIPQHDHAVSQPASDDQETTNHPDGAYFTTGGAYGGAPVGEPMAGTTTSSTGSGQGHENRQPYLALSFVIALAGIFPSRS
jgi:microcystin-dependent protein